MAVEGGGRCVRDGALGGACGVAASGARCEAGLQCAAGASPGLRCATVQGEGRACSPTRPSDCDPTTVCVPSIEGDGRCVRRAAARRRGVRQRPLGLRGRDELRAGAPRAPVTALRPRRRGLRVVPRDGGSLRRRARVHARAPLPPARRRRRGVRPGPPGLRPRLPLRPDLPPRRGARGLLPPERARLRRRERVPRLRRLLPRVRAGHPGRRTVRRVDEPRAMRGGERVRRRPGAERPLRAPRRARFPLRPRGAALRRGAHLLAELDVPPHAPPRRPVQRPLVGRVRRGPHVRQLRTAGSPALPRGRGARRPLPRGGGALRGGSRLRGGRRGRVVVRAAVARGRGVRRRPASRRPGWSSRRGCRCASRRGEGYGCEAAARTRAQSARKALNTDGCSTRRRFSSLAVRAPPV